MSAQKKTSERRKKRAAFLKLGLAGVAVLGIGAAATTAAWTNDAWFSGSASAATVQLQGSLNGTTWTDADTNDSGVRIDIDPAALADLVPGQTRNITLHVRNTSSVDLTISSDVVATGGVFTGALPASATVTGLATTLAPNATDEFTLVVGTDALWPDTYKGLLGAVTVQISGTTSS